MATPSPNPHWNPIIRIVHFLGLHSRINLIIYINDFITSHTSLEFYFSVIKKQKEVSNKLMLTVSNPCNSWQTEKSLSSHHFTKFQVKMSSERNRKHLYLSTLVAITFPKRNCATWVKKSFDSSVVINVIMRWGQNWCVGFLNCINVVFTPPFWISIDVAGCIC